MRSFIPLAVGFASLTSGLAHPKGDQVVIQPETSPAPEKFLIETYPGTREWVTEDEKWQLRLKGINFFDVTEDPEINTLPPLQLAKTPDDQKTTSWVPWAEKVSYPAKPTHETTVKKLIKNLEKDNMRKHLETFTAFHTRYYKSDFGRQSSEWLLGQVNDTLKEAGALEHGAYVKPFRHSWGQNSIIATVPGKSNKTVVIGAHQDSINLFFPSLLAAPGADDDGSGTVTILEAMRVLLQSDDILNGEAENTVEFHWYSAEEGGLLGSQAIFNYYQENGRDVKAMLQQDMTGYVQNTIDAGEKESVGVITDFVDPGLTTFIKEVITEYCDIPYIETKCGYACSDHASAAKAGYPSAFVIESDFKYSDKKIHTSDDKMEYLSFDHMLQHARLTLGLAYELAFAKF